MIFWSYLLLAVLEGSEKGFPFSDILMSTFERGGPRLLVYSDTSNGSYSALRVIKAEYLHQANPINRDHFMTTRTRIRRLR